MRRIWTIAGVAVAACAVLPAYFESMHVEQPESDAAVPVQGSESNRG